MKTLFKNGRIYTEDTSCSWAEAMLVAGKYILCTGSESDCRHAAGDDAEVIDLQGKLVLPGFLDGHTHPATVAKTYWAIRADELTKDKAKLMDNIACNARKYSKEERPYFYYENYFAETFGESGPRKEDLDAVISDRPARIQEFGDHACWYNSTALDMLKDENGVPHAESPIGEPLFVKDANGEYTGLCYESVVDGDTGIFEKLGWCPKQVMDDEIALPFLQALKAHGVMALMDGFTESDEDLQYIYDLDKKGRLNMYYEATSILNDVSELEESIRTLRRWQEKYTTEHIRCNTIKFFIDGTNELGDCFSTQPFPNRPGENYYGSAYADQEEVRNVLIRLNQERIDFHVHTICDGAFRLMCNAVEDAKNACGDDWCIKVCLAHCEIISPEDRHRIHDLGMYIDWSTHWSGGYFGEAAQLYLGRTRWDTMYDFTDIIADGEHVGFSSDVFSYQEAHRANPFFGMQTAMTRIDPEFPLDSEKYPQSIRPPVSARLSLKQLLHGYTMTNAIRMRLDEKMGSLTPGKLANFIVLEDDLLALSPNEVKDTRIEQIWFEGQKKDYPEEGRLF